MKKIPSLLKPLSFVIKSAIRHTVYGRLKHVALNEKQALWWNEKIKKWPAIFNKPFTVIEVLKPGIRMDLNLRDVVQRTLITEGEWDPHVYTTLEGLLKKGDTFFDVGANVGYFSLAASKWVGAEGQVLSFEPSIRSIDAFSHNQRLNDSENTLLLSVGVGCKTECKELLWATANNTGASSVVAAENGQGRKEKILMISLDWVISEYGLCPNVLKIDVEGFEFEVLKGMEQFLRNNKPHIICELTEEFLHKAGTSASELIGFMEALGYRCHELRAHAQPIGDILSSSQSLPSHQVDVLFTTDQYLGKENVR